MTVIDAKYKRLRNSWPERPAGVDRSDLCQLTTYLARLDSDSEGAGMLLYPLDVEQAGLSDAESRGPWRMEPGTGTKVWFERIPVVADAAIQKRAELLRDPNE